MNWPECDKCGSSTCCGGCREPETEREVTLELLDTLREILAITDRNHSAWDKARAAIAKAERNS